MKSEDALKLTTESLCHYGKDHAHWYIAFSGGKDSTALLAITIHLLETGAVPWPESITVLYADTGMELPPLHFAAIEMLKAVHKRGIAVRIVKPKLDHRFFVYLLGRGIAPPTNSSRFCTRILKADPMHAAVEKIGAQKGDKLLALTGVRLGESAARDGRISQSCSKDGGECGQGWFQNIQSEFVGGTLAPIVHWRACFVWDALIEYGILHKLPTQAIAEIYGAYEDGEFTAAQLGLRTGCVQCNLVEEDKSLTYVVSRPQWECYKPLIRLRSIYRDVLAMPSARLRKVGDRKKNGELAARQGRLGAVEIDVRCRVLKEILALQDEVNAAALRAGQPLISLISKREHARILELLAQRQMPQGWTGKEQNGALPYDQYSENGDVQLAMHDLGKVYL